MCFSLLSGEVSVETYGSSVKDFPVGGYLMFC